jgi:hypothetical protein
MFHRKPTYSAEELLALYWKLKGTGHSANAAANPQEGGMD